MADGDHAERRDVLRHAHELLLQALDAVGSGVKDRQLRRDRMTSIASILVRPCCSGSPFQIV